MKIYKINIYTTPERPLISSLNINTSKIKIIKLTSGGLLSYNVFY